MSDPPLDPDRPTRSRRRGAPRRRTWRGRLVVAVAVVNVLALVGAVFLWNRREVERDRERRRTIADHLHDPGEAVEFWDLVWTVRAVSRAVGRTEWHWQIELSIENPAVAEQIWQLTTTGFRLRDPGGPVDLEPVEFAGFALDVGETRVVCPVYRTAPEPESLVFRLDFPRNEFSYRQFRILPGAAIRDVRRSEFRALLPAE